tara:strand:+ start:259 stop:381 length:123 start_codon:yes stop_codon:yes gene_type:complete
MSQVDVVHSVNIMVAILIGGVCYMLYLIFKEAEEEKKKDF